MKAVILAAGMGMRLDSPMPKPLVPLTETKTILDFLIDHLTKKVGLDRVCIVVGYKAHLIMERHPGVLYAYNHEYAKNGTAKSLLTALSKIHDEDVLWMNGDLYCDEAVFDKILNAGCSCALVDSKECGEEEVKYTLSKDGFIHELSKNAGSAKGEALGMNLIQKKDLEKFKKELAAVGKKDFFEKALENLTLRGELKFKPIDKGDAFCHEIDFDEDLELVRKHIL